MILKNTSKRVAYTIFVGSKPVTLAPGKAIELKGFTPEQGLKIKEQLDKLPEIKKVSDRTKEVRKQKTEAESETSSKLKKPKTKVENKDK